MTAPQYPTIQSLRGIAGSLPRPIAWQEVEQIAQEEHSEDVARSRTLTAG
jgi:hypothetical protein